ncbi:hypothetical protein LWI29_033386 [Acer saccharum]|uniref:Uncharacterized protein n=1 Tax=Acer saccharum TaxID=4024 RepID=A0AA39VLW2_ACESA|nr:hypothetical protein LWI29_033386 [Acer saccharum]
MACRHRAKYHSILGGKKFSRRVIKFAEFVDVSLLRFCKLGFSMQKFRLLTCLLDVEGASSLLDKWIGLTVKNHVKELDFDVPPRENVMYTLPQIIFLAESVTVLKLAGCKLEQPCNSLRFRSLKSLILKEVHLIEEMLHKLSTECPSLEDLLLFECWGFSRIYFSRACKLKIISIEESSQETLQSVKVIVPSLQGFTLIRFKRMGSCSIDLTGCSNLNKLSLFQANLMDQDLHCLISNFPLLENLCFSGCDFPNRVSISSHGIKILKFWDCHNIKTIDVDTPNLVSFVYSNNSIPISSINVPCPWEISMEHVVAENDTLWFMKLKEFLGVSNQIKDMKLYVKWDDEDLRAIDEFRNSLTSVPSEVGELSLRLIRGPLSSRAAWLDRLFGHFYSRNLKVPVINEADAKFVEVMLKFYLKLFTFPSKMCHKLTFSFT